MREIYIYPPRANSAVPITELSKFDTWTAQLKYNDTHIIVWYKVDGAIEIWNRHKAKANIKQPNLYQELKEIGQRLGWKPGQWMLIDGGYLNDKHKAIKGKIVLWDVLVHNSELLRDETYAQRYNRLFIESDPKWLTLGEISEFQVPRPQMAIGSRLTSNVFVAKSVDSDSNDVGRLLVWAAMEEANEAVPGSRVFEGILFKQVNSKLSLGLKEQNNGSWLVRCRFPDKRYRC